mmetsp:Transcript_43/g.139  ORF Transcript_43/g.139 Transcript_43/m.139 type:complete len:224 (+) Transcript_43:731-1402(+)
MRKCEREQIETPPVVVSLGRVREQHKACEHIVCARVLCPRPWGEVHRRLLSAGCMQNCVRWPLLISMCEDIIIERRRVKVGKTRLHVEHVPHGDFFRVLSKQGRQCRSVGGHQHRVHVHSNGVIERENTSLHEMEDSHGGDGFGAAAKKKLIEGAHRPRRSFCSLRIWHNASCKRKRSILARPPQLQTKVGMRLAQYIELSLQRLLQLLELCWQRRADRFPRD